MIEREEVNRAKEFIRAMKAATPETRAAVMAILKAPDDETARQIVAEYKAKIETPT